VASGDYDGDGSADILWRHDRSGENEVWLMDGADHRASAIPFALQPIWKVVPPDRFGLVGDAGQPRLVGGSGPEPPRDPGGEPRPQQERERRRIGDRFSGGTFRLR
jgi:hypothetical protein